MDFSQLTKPLIEALLIAIAVVGVVEYVKGIPWKAAPPTWIWAVANPVLCGAGAALFHPFPAFFLSAALALALSQLGYQTLIQGISAAIDSATGANIQPPKTP